MSNDDSNGAVERMEVFVRDNIITQLESYFEVKSSVSEGLEEEGREALFEAYKQEVNAWSYPKIWSLVLVFDYCFPTHPQVYGLLTSLYASWILAVDKFEGPESIVDRVYLQNTPEERLMQRAKESAVGVEGAVFLTLGFVFQLIAVSWTSRTELIHENILQGQASATLFAVILVILPWLLSYGLNKIQD